MKYILIIMDGGWEEGSSSPMKAAHTPSMDMLRKQGHVMMHNFCPPDRQPDSLVCILSMLGAARYIPEGRAWLEALAMGVEPRQDQVVMRLNLVSVKKGRLHSFNGEGLSFDEMERLAQSALLPPGLKLFNAGEYRNIVIMDKSVDSVSDMPPHEHVGENMDSMLSVLDYCPQLRQIAEEVRLRKKGISYQLYPWGMSGPCTLPSFTDIWRRRGTLICRTPVVAGIGMAMGMEVIVPEGATADTNTDLTAKAQAAIGSLAAADVVIVHVNGTDEASHRRDSQGKAEFISRIDQELISPLQSLADSEVCLCITSDHRTSTITGRHERGVVEVIADKKLSRLFRYTF